MPPTYSNPPSGETAICLLVPSATFAWATPAVSESNLWNQLSLAWIATVPTVCAPKSAVVSCPESAWEKAARGTDERTYPWGKVITGALANYGNKVGDTTAAGNYEDGKSPYGALDMAGNVLEWVSDWYDETYYESSPASNPLGPPTGNLRVLKGGPWNKSDYSVRSAFRSMDDPTNSVNSIGFRCALSP